VNHKLLGVLLVGVTASAACVDQLDDVEPEETSTTEQASHGHGPDPEDEMFANAVADAMVDRIVTLLFREFAVTTPENAAVGSAAISNIFHDDNDLMRLVGDVGPLQRSNRPDDRFERDALAAAKNGQNFSRTEKVNGRWWVRKSIAVSTGFSPSCVFCHSNFSNLSNPWVGALMVRAKVE
jgi:hypothetical protein